MVDFFVTDRVLMVMNFVDLALGPTGRAKMLTLKTTKPTWHVGRITNELTTSFDDVRGVPTRRPSSAGE